MIVQLGFVIMANPQDFHERTAKKKRRRRIEERISVIIKNIRGRPRCRPPAGWIELGKIAPCTLDPQSGLYFPPIFPLFRVETGADDDKFVS